MSEILMRKDFFIKKYFYNKDCEKEAIRQGEIINRISGKYVEIANKINEARNKYTLNERLRDEAFGNVESIAHYNDTVLFANSMRAYLKELGQVNGANGEIPWIYTQKELFERGRIAEEEVEKTINIYNATFRKENTFFNVILPNATGYESKTRENDALIITDIGIFVLEIKSFHIGAEKKSKVKEQINVSRENIRAFLKNNGINNIKIYSYIIEKSGSDTDNTIITKEQLYEEYENIENNTNVLLSEEEIKKIRQTIESNRLVPKEKPEYYYDSKENAYRIKNENGQIIPSFAYYVLDEKKLEEDIKEFEIIANNTISILNSHEFNEAFNQALKEVEEKAERIRKNAKKEQEEREAQLKKQQRKERILGTKENRLQRILIFIAFGTLAISLIFFLIYAPIAKKEEEEKKQAQVEALQEMDKAIRKNAVERTASILSLPEGTTPEEIKQSIEGKNNGKIKIASIIYTKSDKNNTETVYMCVDTQNSDKSVLGNRPSLVDDRFLYYQYKPEKRKFENPELGIHLDSPSLPTENEIKNNNLSGLSGNVVEIWREQ